MNEFERKIHKARRGFISSPIFVKICRRGFMFYTVEVQKGPTIMCDGTNHNLTTRKKAIERAEEIIENFITPKSNFRVVWKCLDYSKKTIQEK